MFDGTLGKCTGSKESKEDAKPYHAKPLLMPIIQKATLKKEVDRSIKLGVLNKINILNGKLLLFIIPKINGTVAKIYL